MYEAPQNLFILVLVDLYCRGMVPKECIIETVHIVVSYIHKFDEKSAEWPLYVEGELQGLNPQIRALYKSRLWDIEHLDHFHALFDTLKKLVVVDQADSVYIKPLRANSLIGGFTQDMVVHFSRLDFDGRAGMWNAFCIRRNQLFSIPDQNILGTTTSLFPVREQNPNLHLKTNHNEEELGKVSKLIRNLDIHGAIDEIHRVFDQCASARPSEALVLVFGALFLSSNMEHALKVAEQAIIFARNSHDVDTIISVVMLIWEALYLFPDAKVPSTIGNIKQLLEYLITVSAQTSPGTRFQIAVFEVTYLRKTGASLDILARKLAALTKLYSSIVLKSSVSITFHCESYEVWSLYGKADLAKSHYDMVQKLKESEPEAHDLSYIFQMVTLLEKGIEGSTTEALSLLRSLKPSENLVKLQDYKTTELILSLFSLTKSLKLQQAASVLKILREKPGNQCVMYRTTTKYAEIELLLAQGLNAEAYEKSMDEYTRENNPKYVLYAARSLFCFSESSMKVRRVEALEMARGCEDCNSVPIKIEAKIIRALAHAYSDNVAELIEGRNLCDDCIPRACAAQRPRLLMEAMVTKTMCILQLYYTKNATIKEVIECYNLAQAFAASLGTDLLPQTRQLQELFEDISRENGDSHGINPPATPQVKSSLISVGGENADLKRKSTHAERRASKRRRSLLVPL